MPLTFIALGSNQRQPLQQLQGAISKLRAHPQCQVLECSHFYWSAAVGPGQQANYLNAVAAVDTSLLPQALLKALKHIERRHGRTRGLRWGARPLDLDILLYGSECIDGPRLQIPHRQLKNRRFVLQPLFELRPAVVLPDGQPLRSALLALNGAKNGTDRESGKALRLYPRKPL